MASFYLCLTNPPRAWLACRCISRQRRSRDRDPDFPREFAKTASPATITKSAVFLLELPGPHRAGRSGSRLQPAKQNSCARSTLPQRPHIYIYIHTCGPVWSFLQTGGAGNCAAAGNDFRKRYAPHDTLTGLLVLILTGPRWNQSMTVSLGCQVLGHAHCSAVLPRE